MTILDQIVEDKKIELKSFPKKIKIESNRTPLSFKTQLQKADHLALISEVKRASPSKGDIKLDVDPVKQAASYEAGGADAISVLTDPAYFKGTMDDLKQIRSAVNIPILNKNFIIDERQIYQAYNAGADILLLIVTILDNDCLNHFYKIASNLGMDVIVEVHDAEEMERALDLNPDIIGINNRNLKEFVVDISNTENLLEKYYRSDIYFISESGMKNSEDTKRMNDAGASGLLVGETLMTAEDTAGKIQELKLDSVVQ